MAEIDLGEGDAGFVLGEGPVGILLIHGLTGTPTELRQVAKGLAKAGNCTVYVPTLAGHCGDNSDLQATGWRDWYEGVRKTFVGVKQRHEQVFVGGLSMGAVMSMYLASEHPGQVAGLLMYSTTLKYDGWSINKMAFITPLLIRIPFGVAHIDDQAPGATIYADAKQLKQACLNLIINAIDAMPEGGRLTLGIRTLDDTTVISIADTGQGIPADMIERIFTPFVTTKASGTGLGLAKVYSIMESHDGSIECASEKDAGATFSLYIPAMGEDDEDSHDA